jgi:hypothetical protein
MIASPSIVRILDLLFRPRPFLAKRGPLLPFGDRLLVDAMPLGEGSQALLTMLIRLTHRLDP